MNDDQPKGDLTYLLFKSIQDAFNPVNHPIFWGIFILVFAILFSLYLFAMLVPGGESTSFKIIAYGISGLAILFAALLYGAALWLFWLGVMKSTTEKPKRISLTYVLSNLLNMVAASLFAFGLDRITIDIVIGAALMISGGILSLVGIYLGYLLVKKELMNSSV